MRKHDGDHLDLRLPVSHLVVWHPHVDSCQLLDAGVLHWGTYVPPNRAGASSIQHLSPILKGSGSFTS